MTRNSLLKPVLKWVGGKRQLLDEILPLIPKKPRLYAEPFIGGGAVLLSSQPQHAIVGDSNSELINVYSVIRDDPEGLIKLLYEHKNKNNSDYFYKIRSMDREPNFSKTDPVIRAARIIYLNKTCYNGLYRVNSAGQINTPYGKYKNPNIVNEVGIRALSKYLQGDISLICGDYTSTLRDLPKGSFVYLDPPYMPLSQTSAFTGYTEGGFSYEEQVRLRDQCLKMREQGIRFLQSNSDSPEIRELYSDFKIRTVQAKRAVNSKSDRRGNVNEVLIIG